MLGLFSTVKDFVPKGKKVIRTTEHKTVKSSGPTQYLSIYIYLYLRLISGREPADGGSGGAAALQDHHPARAGLLHPRHRAGLGQ